MRSAVSDVVVVKFGGSILKNGRDYLRAARIVKSLAERGSKVVVVVSAMKGVTDELLSFGSRSASDILGTVKQRYFSALEEIAPPIDPQLVDIAREMSMLSSELTKALWAAEILGEISPRVRDYIVSFGERFSILLMSAALRRLGLRCRWFTGREAGIVTDASFGDAKPIHEVSKKLVTETLGSVLEEGVVPVVAGFIAGTIEGTVTVLGRGGSDYTATLLASYLGAEEVRLYTDVPGIMSVDPSIDSDARVVPLMSFDEAMELAYLGAKRFHPRTFEPLRDSNTVVRVLGVDDDSGTSIDRYGGGPPLKAIAMLRNLAMVSVVGTGMVGKLGAAAEIMKVFAASGANIIGIVQPVSESCISIIIERNHLETVLSRLRKLVQRGLIRDAIVYEPVAAVSIVGHGLRDPEILNSVVSKALGWPMKVVSWTSTSLSVSFILSQDSATKFARELHREVVLRWWTS